MGNFTRINAHLFSWKPLAACSVTARWLWLALYAGTTSKRLVPGLWHGGYGALAETAHMGPQDVHDGVAELVRQGLAAQHRASSVLRLTTLPDDAERPANGKVLLGWWTRFQTVPQSIVRDQHVHVLYTLLTSQTPTSNHIEAWGKTFGTISVPSLEALPGEPTVIQASLFEDAETVDETVSGNGMRYRFETVSDTVSPSSDFNTPETVSDTVRYPDLGSGYLGSGSGREGIGEGAITGRTIVATLAASSQRFAGAVDERLVSDLDLVARNLVRERWTLDHVRVVGEWLNAGGMDWKQDLGARWASAPGNLAEAVAHAHAWNTAGRPDLRRRSATPPQNARGAAPPAPAAAFAGGGRRKLT